MAETITVAADLPFEVDIIHHETNDFAVGGWGVCWIARCKAFDIFKGNFHNRAVAMAGIRDLITMRLQVMVREGTLGKFLVDKGDA